MWRISHETRVLILNCLVNGMAMRATARVAGVAVNTVARLLDEIGVLADQHHQQNVVGVESRRIQIDEVWGFVGAKQKNAPTSKTVPAAVRRLAAREGRWHPPSEHREVRLQVEARRVAGDPADRVLLDAGGHDLGDGLG